MSDEGDEKVTEHASKVVKVEQVVIGSDGAVYRSESVKRRLAYQKSVGNPVWSRLAIARVEATEAAE